MWSTWYKKDFRKRKVLKSENLYKQNEKKAAYKWFLNYLTYQNRSEYYMKRNVVRTLVRRSCEKSSDTFISERFIKLNVINEPGENSMKDEETLVWLDMRSLDDISAEKVVNANGALGNML